MRRWLSHLDDALLVVVLGASGWWGIGQIRHEDPSSPRPVIQRQAEDARSSVDRVKSMLAELEIKGRAPKTGYERAAFGQRWADVDHNGCDTRNDMLRRDLLQVAVKPGTNGCVVLSGELVDR